MLYGRVFVLMVAALAPPIGRAEASPVAEESTEPYPWITYTRWVDSALPARIHLGHAGDGPVAELPRGA